jgi:hypothetical protein
MDEERQAVDGEADKGSEDRPHVQLTLAADVEQPASEA